MSRDTPTDLSDTSDPGALPATMPFAVHAGVVIDQASEEAVDGHLDWAPERCTIGGILHGGALMTLADSAGATCAFLNLPADAASTSTIESKTNFLGAATKGTVVATARPLHVGSTTIVVETELRVGDRLVGKTTQTQIVRRKR